MRKLSAVFLITLFLVLSSSRIANAQILTVTSGGEVIFNVLSEESDSSIDIPRHSYIEVTRVGDEEGTNESSVFLSKVDGKISLLVAADNETRELNVANQNQNLIEIEERSEVQKISIGISDDKFYLQQRGIWAITDYPVKVDAESASLSVKTQTGDRYLSIFPKEATESVLRTNLVSKLKSNRIEIEENEGDIRYKIEALKVFDFYNIYAYEIPVTAFVSASTGEVLGIDSPTWYKYVGFLFI